VVSFVSSLIDNILIGPGQIKTVIDRISKSYQNNKKKPASRAGIVKIAMLSEVVADQPTFRHVPSGWRQAVPTIVCGSSSIYTVCSNSRQMRPASR